MCPRAPQDLFYIKLLPPSPGDRADLPNSSETELNETEISNILDKELKVMVIKILHGLEYSR